MFLDASVGSAQMRKKHLDRLEETIRKHRKHLMLAAAVVEDSDCGQCRHTATCSLVRLRPVSVTHVGLLQLLESGHLYCYDPTQWHLYAPLRIPALRSRESEDAAPVLEVFWERYRGIYPNFQLFQRIDSGNCAAKRCVPFYIHGDEGTTYKRAGALIISFQSRLGYGTSRRTKEMSVNLENLGESGLPLNFAL